MTGGLSPKAYGFLLAIVQHNLTISAESLMAHFKGTRGAGRQSVLSGLKEMREYGYIVTRVERVYGKTMKVSYVTEKGKALFFGINSEKRKYGFPTIDTSNEHISRNTISTVISKNMVSTKSKINSEIEEFEVISMSGWGGLFSSNPENDYQADLKADKIKEKNKRTSNFESAKRVTGKKRAGRRSEVPKNEWSVPDVCFEFADRIEQHFNIAPWKVTQSSFSGALGGARNRLGTNGQVEVDAMDLFFKQISISEYKDAEVLWRLFISRLPGLIGQAVLSRADDEDKKVAEESRAKARKLLRGEDV